LVPAGRRIRFGLPAAGKRDRKGDAEKASLRLGALIGTRGRGIQGSEAEQKFVADETFSHLSRLSSGSGLEF